MENLLFIYAIIFGALIGSFLNVVIYRVPRKLGLVFERSHCPQCKKLIPWYLNMPLVSFIILRGKCRYCKSKIPVKYFLVELVTAFFSGYLLYRNGIGQDGLLLYLFQFTVFCIFLCHFLIDIEFQILPDSLNIFLFLIVFPYVVINNSYSYWLIGGAIGFFGPLAITWAFYLLRGQVGMGGGDIKLFGILGLLFGPIGIIHNIFLSCFLGSLIILILMALKKVKKSDPVAFGPAILIVSFIQIYFPELLAQFLP